MKRGRLPVLLYTSGVALLGLHFSWSLAVRPAPCAVAWVVPPAVVLIALAVASWVFRRDDTG